jgi:hypothetical protein
MTEIRFIRRDAALPRRERSEGEAATDPSAENLNPLVRSVAGATMEEIELIILELQRIRDMLNSESGRLSREIARYAGFNQSLLATMKVVRESLKPIASTNGKAHP